VALQDFAAGDTAIKYGEDIGRFVGPAEKGGHVHTHNLKTKRW
jgi:(2R)-sulfolactate sulfo-lyase subunit alpha